MRNTFNRYLILFATVLFWLSCGVENKPIGSIHKSLTIPIYDCCQQNINMNLSTIASKVDYVPLDPKIPIKNLGKIIHSKQKYYVLDYRSILHVYDEDGTYINQIGSKGKGPGEYLAPANFLVLNDESVVIVDRLANKMIKYDKYGAPIKELRSKHFIAAITKTDQNTFAGLVPMPREIENGGIQLVVFDSNLNIIKEIAKPKTENYNETVRRMRMIANTSFYNFDDSIRLWQFYKNTQLMSYSPPDYKMKVNFEFDPGKIIPEEYLLLNGSLDYNKYSDYILIVDVMESSRFLFVEAITEGKYLKCLLIDKNEKHFEKACLGDVFHLELRDNGFQNDLDGGWPFWPRGSFNSGQMYDVFTADILLKYMEHAYYDKIEVSESVKTLLEDNLEATNYILMIVHLK